MKTTNDIEQLITEYVNGDITNERKELLEQLIREKKIDPDQFLEIRQIHDELGAISIPDPSPEVAQRFYNMLEQEKQAYTNSRAGILQSLTESVQRLNLFNVRTAAIAFPMLVIGLLIGSQFSPQDESQIDMLSSEIQQMRQILMLTMLDNPSAMERIQAVNIGYQLENADDQIIDALLATLNTDSNINVRLQAIDTLLRWGDRPSVRLGLLNAIERQESPHVLIALADAMTYLNEDRSIDMFERLLAENEFDPSVEQKLMSSISELR